MFMWQDLFYMEDNIKKEMGQYCVKKAVLSFSCFWKINLRNRGWGNEFWGKEGAHMGVLKQKNIFGKEFGKRSIYKRIIIYFLSLCLLTGILCTGIYREGFSIINNEISQVIEEKNNGSVNNIYNFCQQIRMMLYQFGGTEDVIDLIISQQSLKDKVDIRQTKEIKAIQESLSMVWKGNSMIEDVCLINPTTNLVITTGTFRYIQEEDEALLKYFRETQTSGNLFSYEGDMIIMSEYLLGEYYIYARLTGYALEKGLLGSKGQSPDQCFLYNVREGDSVGNTDDTVLEFLKDEGWRSAQEQPVDKKGYLYDVSEIERSDYVSVTYYADREIYSSMNFYRAFYCLLLGLIVAGACFFSRWLYMILHRPMKVLLEGLEKVRNGDLDTVISVHRDDEFQEIYESFNSMTVRLKQLIEKNYRQEILLKKSELKQLQSQIAPHFLYNSFIVLSNRINAEDYEFAAEFSRELGQYFMFLTRSGREYIPLKEELEHAWSYARIQHVRFRNRLNLQLDELEEDWKETLVPRLIVQPVFENVFKYVVGKSRDFVTIHMGFVYEEDAIRIIIENSGEITDEELSVIAGKLGKVDDEIHGMANIHQRLMLIYNGEGGVELGRSQLGGLKVTLKLKREIPEGELDVQNFISG